MLPISNHDKQIAHLIVQQTVTDSRVQGVAADVYNGIWWIPCTCRRRSVRSHFANSLTPSWRTANSSKISSRSIHVHTRFGMPTSSNAKRSTSPKWFCCHGTTCDVIFVSHNAKRVYCLRPIDIYAQVSDDKRISIGGKFSRLNTAKWILLKLLLLLLNMRQITVTLSQPNVAGALYKVSEDMPMSVNA